MLDEVRRLRPRRPIDGVLAAVSVPQLGGAETDEAISARIRARIDDVLDRFDLIVPVYVVVTMADRLPGFAEFWSGFSRPDDSTWGASFASDDDTRSTSRSRAVGKELETLAQSLHSEARRPPPERGRRPARRVGVLRFPLEFRALAGAAGAARRRAVPARVPPPSGSSCAASTSSAPRPPPTRRGPHFLTDFFRSVVLPGPQPCHAGDARGSQAVPSRAPRVARGARPSAPSSSRRRSRAT